MNPKDSAKEKRRKKTCASFCRGREIRTPINGFGDRYSTLKLFPIFCWDKVEPCPNKKY